MTTCDTPISIPKKIASITSLTITLAVAATATVAIWAHYLGTFSIPAIGSSLNNNFSTWQDRLEFNKEFGLPDTGSAPGIESLLAIIGLTSPSAGSQVILPSSANAESIPVLLYHGIVPVSEDPDETSIANFKAQMFALKNAGWQTITIEQFVAAMKGQATLPPKSFLLTFDDGRQDAYDNATPILKALGYQAVMYVITGHSLAPGNQKSKYYVTQDQLAQMLSSGVWELQSHSDIGHAQYPINAAGTLGDFFGNELWIPVQDPGESSSSYAARVYTDLSDYFTTGKVWNLSDSHSETTAEYENRIETDLINAKNMLQTKLSVNAISFAYPYNDFAQDLNNDAINGTPALINFVDQIYDVGFYQWYPSLGFSQNYPGADGQLLKRIEPKPDWTPDYLLSTFDDGQAKALPYTMSADDNWVGAWGDISQSNGTLSLAATSTTAGASTILDGSRLWTSYDYTVQFNWQNAESVSLFAHYQASPLATDYLACNFSNGSVRLENHENGMVDVISQKNNAAIIPGNGNITGITISGNSAACSWGGNIITSGSLPPSAPTSGGIGIEIWNPTNGTANITVTHASAQ